LLHEARKDCQEGEEKTWHLGEEVEICSGPAYCPWHLTGHQKFILVKKARRGKRETQGVNAEAFGCKKGGVIVVD